MLYGGALPQESDGEGAVVTPLLGEDEDLDDLFGCVAVVPTRPIGVDEFDVGDSRPQCLDFNLGVAVPVAEEVFMALLVVNIDIHIGGVVASKPVVTLFALFFKLDFKLLASVEVELQSFRHVEESEVLLVGWACPIPVVIYGKWAGQGVSLEARPIARAVRMGART